MKQIPELRGLKGAWIADDEAKGLANLLTAYARDLAGYDITSWGFDADNGYMYMFVNTHPETLDVEMRSYWGGEAVYVLKQDDDEYRLCVCFNEYLEIQEQTKP